MKGALAVAVLLACCFVRPAETKGGVRTYGSVKPGGKAWKYGLVGAAVGAGVAVAAYTVAGSLKKYYHHISYDHDYDDYYNRQSASWRNRFRRRRANCRPPVEPNRDETDAWVHVQLVIENPTIEFVELEMDLFRELAWRAPCTPPTDIVIRWRCPGTSKVSVEVEAPTNCQAAGSLIASPLRRNLLQTSGSPSVVYISIGVDEYDEADELLEALRESLQDEGSMLKRHYQMRSTPVYYDTEESSALKPGLVVLLLLIAVMM